MTDHSAEHAAADCADARERRLRDEQVYLLAGLMLPGWGAELLLEGWHTEPAPEAAPAPVGGWLGRWLPGRLAA